MTSSTRNAACDNDKGRAGDGSRRSSSKGNVTAAVQASRPDLSQIQADEEDSAIVHSSPECYNSSILFI